MKHFRLLLLLVLPVLSQAQTSRDTSKIFFAYNSDEISSSSAKTLLAFVEQFEDQQGNIELYGHCDFRGSDEYNDRLSLSRSAAVKNFLVSNGIPASSITIIKGLGESMPLNDNSTESLMAANRGVEIVWEKRQAPPAQETPEKGHEPVPPAEKPKEFSRETIESTEVGEKLVLPMINFRGGLHRFLPSAMASLEELHQVMNDNPQLEIEIQGHICCRAGIEADGMDMETGEYNLSTARAKAVYDYLADKGIKKSRMRYKGFAGMFPLIQPERSEADRTANRRVEILILKK